MNRDEFFAGLGKALSGFPAEERGKTQLFYQELYADLIEDGCSEEEAVARLGDPEKIAADLTEEQAAASQVLPKERGRRIWVIVLLALGFPLWGSLLLTAALLLLTVYILLWIPALTLGLCALIFLAVAVAVPVASLFLMPHNLPYGLAQMGAGFICLGLAIFSVLGLIACCKALAKATAAVTRWVTGLFRKQRRKTA
ncbi:MAG: DUF1700 domain-containing protein [Clostridiales bacterium]|nr:DUF1700 domain-containing protein [Clostridiales bacterium]